MPLSDNQGEGFQNKIIEVLARRSGHAMSAIFWRPYHRARADARDVRRTTNATSSSTCRRTTGVLTTEPIYRTTYVLAYRNDKDLDITGLDDPKLKELKIGVYQHLRPARGAERRGINNLVAAYHQPRHAIS